MNIPILYEDNHLLVVEKPANVPVQQDRSRDPDLLNLLKKYIKKRDDKPGNVFLGLVHRLDRPVGGVIVFAKTSKAASRLSDAIRRNQFKRTYLAVVRGIPKQKNDKLVNYLYKDRKKNKVYPVSKNHHQGKKAILTYEVLEHNSKEQLSLLSVQLHTGRSHQIRVQLATIGHPLFGDQKYGAKVNQPGEQLALCAHTLSFPHTTSKEWKTFRANPPSEFPWTLWNHESFE